MHDSGDDLNSSDIGNVYALYCYDIEPQIISQEHFLTLLKQGNTRIEAQFTKALTSSVTCIAYATFSALFKVTGFRDVILE